MFNDIRRERQTVSHSSVCPVLQKDVRCCMTMPNHIQDFTVRPNESCATLCRRFLASSFVLISKSRVRLLFYGTCRNWMRRPASTQLRLASIAYLFGQGDLSAILPLFWIYRALKRPAAGREDEASLWVSVRKTGFRGTTASSQEGKQSSATLRQQNAAVNGTRVNKVQACASPNYHVRFTSVSCSLVSQKHYTFIQILWDFKFSSRWLWRNISHGMWRRVVW